MILTDPQRRTVHAILNIFETSAVLGKYGQVTLIAGDTGGLTYGRSQTTINSGNLLKLIDAYVRAPEAQYAAALGNFRGRIAAKDATLADDGWFKNLLRAAADDPIMRATQDSFFDSVYFAPAFREAERLDFVTPLAMAVVFDGFIHGSWGPIRNLTNHEFGTPDVKGERPWVDAYITRRQSWLANHQRADLRATVYRPREFRAMIDRGDWALALPLLVRGVEVSLDSLSALPPEVYEGPAPGSRTLSVGSTMPRGRDVRLLQLALSDPTNGGLAIVADGAFGNSSAGSVDTYRRAHGLAPGRFADITVFQALGLA